MPRCGAAMKARYRPRRRPPSRLEPVARACLVGRIARQPSDCVARSSIGSAAASPERTYRMRARAQPGPLRLLCSAERRVDNRLGDRPIRRRERFDHVALPTYEDAAHVRELTEAVDSVMSPGSALADSTERQRRERAVHGCGVDAGTA